MVQVSDNGRTVLITQNGEAKAVVMDVEVYDRWKAAMAMLKILAQSEAEFEAGKVVSQKEAFSRAEAAIRRVEGSVPTPYWWVPWSMAVGTSKIFCSNA